MWPSRRGEGVSPLVKTALRRHPEPTTAFSTANHAKEQPASDERRGPADDFQPLKLIFRPDPANRRKEQEN